MSVISVQGTVKVPFHLQVAGIRNVISVKGKQRTVWTNNEDVVGRSTAGSAEMVLIPNPEKNLVVCVDFPDLTQTRTLEEIGSKVKSIGAETIRYANQLLLSYREAYGNPSVHPTSIAAVRKVVVRVDDGRAPVCIVWEPRMEFAAEKALAEVFLWGEQGITDVFLGLLVGDIEPVPEWLMMLDSEQALQEGRLREAVISSVTLLELLVDPRIAEFLEALGLARTSWSSFTRDLSLRARLDFFAHLIHPDILGIDKGDLERLEEVRGAITLRNSIIHEGAQCEESDAKRFGSGCRRDCSQSRTQREMGRHT